MAEVSLDILVRGWELPGWKGAFYPDDLPPDWRLTYFANEFPAAMIPVERWRKPDGDLLRDWSRDVPEAFRFYLEVPRSGIDARDLKRIGQLLGGKLAGLVADAAAVRRAPAGPVPRFCLRDDLGAALPDACSVALRVPGAGAFDPRAARARLETLAEAVGSGRGLLVLEGGDIGDGDLRRWWSLAWLMGVA